MCALYRLSKFNSRGKGLLSRMMNMIDWHSKFIEGLDAEDRATIRKNAAGSITIGTNRIRGSTLSVGMPFQIVSAQVVPSTETDVDLLIQCGHWVHRYENFEFDPELCEDDRYPLTITLPVGGSSSAWIYARLNMDLTCGYSKDFPVSNATELRRVIGYVTLTDGEISVQNRISGDIYSW